MAPPARIRLGAARGSGRLGTFGGVFTPSVLTILGIILFRRLGFVVGGAGLTQALVIIAVANIISVLTSISLAAIATNLRVKGGGDYYLISRTLGVEFGGAIGVVLFLAQSVSIAFYCIGFGEAMANVLPWQQAHLPRLVAAVAIAFLFVFAWLGADWATRLQYAVMAILALALAFFFVGGIQAWDAEVLEANLAKPAAEPSFWLLFAIFFPAVTGFTQGVSMSGDLKDPGRSLPLGTFSAVGLSAVVYIAAALLLAGALPADELTKNYRAMNRLSTLGWLVDAGVIAATLSSAMASFLGAPRILQALAADRVFPWLKFFAEGVGPARNPRRGVVLSALIALVTVALGNLNMVAPVVAMFFLISYGLLNYATFYEARAASPSFRPRFRWFDKRLSLLGAVACGGGMLAVSPVAGALSISILFGIYQHVKRTAGPARWADSSRSYLFQRVREHLFALAEGPEHPRDWRPQIVALAKDDHQRDQILRFASWIEGGSGLTSAVYILEGKPSRLRGEAEAAREKLEADIRERQLQAFPHVFAAPDVRTGFEQMLQSYGIGPLRANIVLLNWLEQVRGLDNTPAERQYGTYLREAIRLGRNLVILDAKEEEWIRLWDMPVDQRRIDVWWWGGATSRLGLLLAYLMKRTEEWQDATIRVITQGGEEAERARERLQQMLEEVRIVAESEAVEEMSPEVLAEYSRDAALVFLPLWLRGLQPLDPFDRPPEQLLAKLPVVAMLLAAEDIQLAMEADEGEAAERAMTADEAEDAEAEADKAEKHAASMGEKAEAAEARLARAREQEQLSSEEEQELRESAVAARREVDQAVRQAASARKRADAAAQRAEEAGEEDSSGEKNASKPLGEEKSER